MQAEDGNYIISDESTVQILTFMRGGWGGNAIKVSAVGRCCAEICFNLKVTSIWGTSRGRGFTTGNMRVLNKVPTGWEARITQLEGNIPRRRTKAGQFQFIPRLRLGNTPGVFHEMPLMKSWIVLVTSQWHAGILQVNRHTSRAAPPPTTSSPSAASASSWL